MRKTQHNEQHTAVTGFTAATNIDIIMKNTKQPSTPHSIDNAKRTTLKKLGATAGVAATASASAAIANAALTTNQSNNKPTARESSSAHHLTINLQKNRDDLDDWVLIENMTETPIVVQSFEPRFVQFDNTVLDLQALLSRQQKGKQQLEIWPSHAWTHSTKDAVRTTHALRPTASRAIVMNKESRSAQIPVSVTADGKAILR